MIIIAVRIIIFIRKYIKITATIKWYAALSLSAMCRVMCIRNENGSQNEWAVTYAAASAMVAMAVARFKKKKRKKNENRRAILHVFMIHSHSFTLIHSLSICAILWWNICKILHQTSEPLVLIVKRQIVGYVFALHGDYFCCFFWHTSFYLNNQKRFHNKNTIQMTSKQTKQPTK